MNMMCDIYLQKFIVILVEMRTSMINHLTSSGIQSQDDDVDLLVACSFSAVRCLTSLDFLESGSEPESMKKRQCAARVFFVKFFEAAFQTFKDFSLTLPSFDVSVFCKGTFFWET